MNSSSDQRDDSKFTMHDTSVTMKAYKRYVNMKGGPPSPEQEPAHEQLSAMRRRVGVLQLSPYADFAVWVTLAKKAHSTQTDDVDYAAGRQLRVEGFPGQPTMRSYQVYKMALLILVD